MKFKKEKKEELLAGRTVKYVAENVTHCTPMYLGRVLNGKDTCSYTMAKILTEIDATNKEINYYFEGK